MYWGNIRVRGSRSVGLASLAGLALALAAAVVALTLSAGSGPAVPDIVRAQDLFAVGRFRDAERLLVGRSSPDARWLLARCYLAGGLLEDARDTLAGLTDRPEAARLLVKVCLDRGDFDRALPHLRRLAQEDPKNAELLKLLAHAESKSGNAVAALAAANEAFALDPADPDLGRLVAELASSVSAQFSRPSPPAASSRPSSPLFPSSSLHPISGIRHPQSPQKEPSHGPRPR